MQTRNPLFDDIARVFSGAMGAASGMRNEVEGKVRAQFERILADMDLVTREEFEAVEAMAARARAEQEVLNERIAALEARLAEGKAPGKTATKPKTAAKPKSAAKPKVSSPKAGTAKGKTTAEEAAPRKRGTAMTGEPPASAGTTAAGSGEPS